MVRPPQFKALIREYKGTYEKDGSEHIGWWDAYGGEDAKIRAAVCYGRLVELVNHKRQNLIWLANRIYLKDLK